MLGSSVVFALVELRQVGLIACYPAPDSELLWSGTIYYSPWCTVGTQEISTMWVSE